VGEKKYKITHLDNNPQFQVLGQDNTEGNRKKGLTNSGDNYAEQGEGYCEIKPERRLNWLTEEGKGRKTKEPLSTRLAMAPKKNSQMRAWSGKNQKKGEAMAKSPEEAGGV